MFKKLIQKLHPDKTALLMKQLILVLTGLLIIDFIALNFIDWQYVLVFNLAVLFLLFTLRFINLSFYLMILLYPFIGWQLVYGSINLPYVDVVAMVVFLAWVIRKIYFWKSEKLSWYDFPGLIFMGLFVLSGVLALFNADFVLLSLKYLLRPILFFYLMFVLLPFNIIKTKKQFKTALILLIISGVIVSLFGFASVVFGGDSLFVNRAVPYTIGDFNPIGGNQNAIAEIIVITLPLGLILLSNIKKYRNQAWFVLLLSFLLFILIMTYSRSGYLAIFLALLIFLFAKLKMNIKRSHILPIVLAITVIPILIYITFWKDVSWVQSSDVSRWTLTEISLNAIAEHPVIGNGPGSFVNLVAGTYVYVVDFGDPLDSHGFVQKILVEQGFLGFFAFSSFLIYLFSAYIRAYLSMLSSKHKVYLLAMLMMLSGILLFELFSTSYYLSRVWLPIGITLAGIKLYSPKTLKKLI